MGRANTQKAKPEPLTEQLIQKRLDRFFSSWRYNVDNLYVFEWESDKLIWTKAGYIYEFEIKISRADFKNDFKHKKDKHTILQGPTDEEQLMPMFYQYYEWNKRNYASIEDLKARLKPTDSFFIANHRRPNFFYYAVPEGMIQPEDVPVYAGLVYIPKEHGRLPKTVKKAPQLHKDKYSDAQLNLSEKFYYNWQSDRKRRIEAERHYNEVYRMLREEIESKGQEITYKEMALRKKMAEEKARELEERVGETVRNNIVLNAERKRLRKIILQFDPGYDFEPIEEELDRIYGLTK